MSKEHESREGSACVDSRVGLLAVPVEQRLERGRGGAHIKLRERQAPAIKPSG
jgi:hypothetical protein